MTKPCIINEIEFPSQSAAARHFGVSVSMIGHVLAGRKSSDRLGFGKGTKPIEIEGMSFNSRADAAAFLGVCTSHFYSYLMVKKLIEEKCAQERSK